MHSSPRRKSLPALTVERLVETGFLATECGLDQEAERIFVALAQLRPGKPAPLIALAMTHARQGLMTQAIEEARAVVRAHPESEMAKAILGTMLVHVEQPGALQLFEDLIATGTDPNAIELAKCCLTLARQHETSGVADAQPYEHFRYHNFRP